MWNPKYSLRHNCLLCVPKCNTEKLKVLLLLLVCVYTVFLDSLILHCIVGPFYGTFYILCNPLYFLPIWFNSCSKLLSGKQHNWLRPCAPIWLGLGYGPYYQVNTVIRKRPILQFSITLILFLQSPHLPANVQQQQAAKAQEAALLVCSWKVYPQSTLRSRKQISMKNRKISKEKVSHCCFR